MSNVHYQWQINETFCTMTKGNCDQPNSFEMPNVLHNAEITITIDELVSIYFADRTNCGVYRSVHSMTSAEFTAEQLSGIG